jgi:hypothetical protein
LKTVESMCNDIKKIKCTLMKCHTNDNSTSSTLLPHKPSYTVATPGHNHFESPHASGAPKFAEQLNGAMSIHVRKYVMRKII